MNAHPVLLRAFRSPLVIASILALLVNDHLLKATAPSWLTGKLSDFAGLFFFPFVLGAALEWAAGLARRLFGARAAAPCPAAALRAAFALTAALFVAVKTLPPVSALVVDLLSRITGLPGQIVLDPTDLAALAMFWPAWRLWRRLEQAPTAPRGPANRWAYAVLAAASLAALASDCPPPTRITRLVEHQGVLYAGGPYLAFDGITNSFFTSRDGGLTWSEPQQSAPETVKVALEGQTVLPYQVCAAAGGPCYRIGAVSSPEPLLETSTDGGQTWSAAWQAPEGRFDYMRRGRATHNCDSVPDEQVFDLLLVDGRGGPVLLAAMGNEGLLRHEAGGGWQRIGLGDAQPTPFAAATLQEALGYTSEFFLGLGAGLLAFILLSGLAWQQLARLPRKAPLPAGRGIAWALQPLWYLLGWFGLVVVFIMLIMLSPSGVSFFGPLLLPLTPVFLLIALVQVWMRVGEITAFPRLPGRMAGAAVLGAFGVFFAGWLPFLLWVVWAIRRYSTAGILSATLMLAALAAAGWAILRTARSIDLTGANHEQTQQQSRAGPAPQQDP